MIPAYQMHNVLKAFTENLVKNGTAPQPNRSEALTGPIRIEAASEGKRQAVTQIVTAAILKKITQMGSRQDPGLNTDLKHMTGNKKRPVPSDVKGNQFTYTSVGNNGEKHALTRFVKDVDLVTDPSPGTKQES